MSTTDYLHVPGVEMIPEAFEKSASEAHAERELSVSLSAGPSAIGQARAALSAVQGVLDGRVVADLRLLISELVTNSVRHGGGSAPVSLRVKVWPQRVRVEVADDGPGFTPAPRRSGQAKDSGWGLYLVEQLADRWGVVAQAGTTVWLEIDRA